VVLVRVILISAALHAWTSRPAVAEDGPRGQPQAVTQAIADAARAAKEGRLNNTLGALGKALVAARQSGDTRLVEALEERYQVTWRDVAKLHRAATQAACRCDPKEGAALHRQLEQADLPDRLTSASSGAAYDLHFSALEAVLSHVARVSGTGHLSNDLSAIGEALNAAKEHKLDDAAAALTKHYQALWEQVETLRRKVEAAVASPKAAGTQAVLAQLESSGFAGQVKNVLDGTVCNLPVSDLRAALNASATPPEPISPGKSAPSQPDAKPPVGNTAAPSPTTKGPVVDTPAAAPPAEPSHLGIWVTGIALAVVLAALAAVLSKKGM